MFSVVAVGGAGKSSLIKRWLMNMAEANWRGAEAVFGWSFYDAQQHTQEASADLFIKTALEFFDDPTPEKGSPWEKGSRLAELVCKRRSLLILDGLEVLQYAGAPPEGGKLKDQALQALVRSLVWKNRGLCLISTRVPVADLDDFPNQVRQISLARLSKEAGAQLLKSLGVAGSRAELMQAVEEFRGHALSLTLLGSYLVAAHKGDVRQRSVLDPEQDDQANRIMMSYERWLGESPELDILRMLGLFNRPAPYDALNAVRAAPVIPGLTERATGLTRARWNLAVNRLRELDLVAQENPKRPDTLDTHPLVRQHFARQVHEQNAAAWKEANRRLFEFYKRLPKEELPTTLDEIAHLFHAVEHGCQAGCYNQA